MKPLPISLVALGSFLVLAAAVPALAADGQAADRQGFSDTAQVTAVEIPVQVVKDGEPVRGLTAGDFEIYDGRKRQTITGFDVVDLADPQNQTLSAAIPPAGKRHFLLIFDLANSHPKGVANSREAVIGSLLTTLIPSDLVAVATYGGNSGLKMVLGFTSDRRQIVKAIDSLGYTDFSDHTQQNHMLAQVDFAASLMSQTNLAGPEGPGILDPPDPGETRQQRAREVRLYNQAKLEAQAPTAHVDYSALVSQIAVESKLAQRMDLAEARNALASMVKAFAAMARMMDAVSGRKFVVYFSEGFDGTIIEGDRDMEDQYLMADTTQKGGGGITESDTRYGSTAQNNQIEKLLEALRRSGCVVESVDIGGLRADRDLASGSAGPRPSSEASLFQLAHDTGGELFHNFNDLGQAMIRLARSTAVSYVITFQPQGPLAPGSYHPVKVKLKNAPRGSQVTYRLGYYAPRPFNQVAPFEKQLAAADQLMSNHASGSITTAVLAAPFRTADAKAYVPVLVEADGATLLAGSAGKTVRAEIYVNAVDAEGAILDAFDQGLQLNVEQVGPALRQGGLKFFGHLELPPGEYSVRVLLRNGETGAYGKRAITVTVPAFGGDVPVLLPPFFPEAAGRWAVVRELPRGEQSHATYPFTVGERAYVPAAVPTLAPGEAAAVALVGYHLGEGELAAQARIESSDGRDLGSGELRVGGREPGNGAQPDVYRAVFRAPQGLASGQYRLVITVTGPGGTRTVTSPFSVAGPAAKGG
jgi:VWFA-related protein